MNTLITPAWVKREMVAIFLARTGVPLAITQNKTDEELEQLANQLADAFLEWQAGQPQDE